MRFVLDAGALIALERNDAAMWERFKIARLAGSPPVSHGGVIAQVWRGRGPRHARLAHALESIDIRGLDDSLGRKVGELLAKVRRNDVVDAAIVLIANDGDQILTSDPYDLAPLARAADLDVEIIAV